MSLYRESKSDQSIALNRKIAKPQDNPINYNVDTIRSEYQNKFYCLNLNVVATIITCLNFTSNCMV